VPLSGLISTSYVELYFRQQAKVEELTGMAHEVARKTLNLEDVKKAKVPLPPKGEQDRISEGLEAYLSDIEGAEQFIDASQKKTDSLRQSILKRAFEGRLVPPDPNDEPASELLARIRGEAHSSQKARDLA
jgi:type I restriction enzyme S subunit